MSDIVDNRREKLVDTIGRILDSTESARFAVGYFFVSGLTAVQDKLEDVKELKLLIGNTTNRETIEQMAEGYRRLEMVAGAAEEQLYQKGAEARRVAGLAAREVSDSLEVMDQTDEGERLVKTLVSSSASLRDGIRAGKRSKEKGLYVLCQAGSYRQLYLLDEDGEVISRDLRHVLKAISCERAEPAIPLPVGYNEAVMRVKERFEREVRDRRAERENRRSRNRGQRYVRRELQVFFAGTEDAALRERINALERPFGGPLVGVVERRLNQLQRQGVKGDELLQELEGLYSRYRMYEMPSHREAARGEDDTPHIICSEALI